MGIEVLSRDGVEGDTGTLDLLQAGPHPAQDDNARMGTRMNDLVELLARWPRCGPELTERGFAHYTSQISRLRKRGFVIGMRICRSHLHESRTYQYTLNAYPLGYRRRWRS